MRKIDEAKSTAFGKAQKTINFDKIVLMAVENRAKETGSKVSNLVNDLVRRHFMTDADFYEERAKYHAMKMHEAKYMSERALAIKLLA